MYVGQSDKAYGKKWKKWKKKKERKKTLLFYVFIWGNRLNNKNDIHLPPFAKRVTQASQLNEEKWIIEKRVKLSWTEIRP